MNSRIRDFREIEKNIGIDPKKAEAFAEKSAERKSSVVNHPEQKKAIQVSIPESLLKDVDERIKGGRVKISRNFWIVDAIAKKLETETT